MRRFLTDYGLSVTLAALFIGSWVLQTVSGWVQYVGQQTQHQQVAQLFGQDGYVWHWMESTFENWQSEFLQLFAMVVLTTFLIHRHSKESRDSEDKMQAQIDEILKLVKEQSK